LNCSLPRWTNAFFGVGRKAPDKRLLVLQRFRQACVFHDLCYRHGLATYSYTQNDCDRILQNQAFRLCLYIRNDETSKNESDDKVRRAREAADCQADSKKVLAGVSLGGWGAYRAWGESTYFEFESDPSRSNGFTAARVVRHPFKCTEGKCDERTVSKKYDNESDEVILDFVNVRSNLTVRCLTCKSTIIQESTDKPDNVSAEMKAAGINAVPQAMLGHEFRLDSIDAIWLPPRRRHAAPHLLVDSEGENHLIWMSRNNNENTLFCVVSSDAAKLLTYTLPRSDYCGRSAVSTSAPTLTMVEPDMFSTSPLPMEMLPTGDNHILATTLSAQKAPAHGLSFCSRSASRRINRIDTKKNDDQVKCQHFLDDGLVDGLGLGAFQNFATVRKGQQIFFARDLWLPPSSWPIEVWQNWFGEKYSRGGVMFKFDVAPPAALYEPAQFKLDKPVRFNIPDRLDPMMPITSKNDDRRFLSLEAAEKLADLNALYSKVEIHMIDFVKDNPAVGDILLTMNGTMMKDRTPDPADTIRLHGSWALRPTLVMETRGQKPKTKLVFSRAKMAIQPPDTEVESLRLETVVFERDADPTSNGPFKVTGGAACQVTYTFKPNPDFSCKRAFDPNRSMRSSPAAKMLASQLLVGNFAGSDGYGIAFIDACLRNNPIILRPKDKFETAYTVTTKPAEDDDQVRREVVCRPLGSKESMADPIPD